MADESEAYKAALNALREKFLLKIPGLIDTITSRADELDEVFKSPTRNEKLSEFMNEAHSLAGAAAQFNCDEVSKAAREIEYSYKKNLSCDDVSSAEYDILLKKIDRLKNSTK